MRNRRAWIRRAAPLAFASLAGFPARPAATDEVTYSVEVGAQAVSVDEDRDSKFEEHRDVPQGAVLDSFRLGWLPESSPWSFSAEGRNVLRLDQGYAVTFGRTGRFRVRTWWDQVPTFSSRGSTWLLAGRPGDYTLSSDFRQVLEDAALGGTVEGLVPGVLAASARPLDLRVRRDRAGGALTVNLARGWDLDIEAGREKREGSGRISIGTYIRSSRSAGNFDRESFEVRGLEMPDPVDFRAASYSLSTSFHRKRGFVTVGWQGARFSNEVDTLFWDNPFEAAPSVASASDRGRFARGALDLWPDSTYRRLFASGGVKLPARTRIAATVARGKAEQDDPFLPFTQNEALSFPGPDGTLGTADDVPGTDPSLLPAASLGGEATTTRADFRISSRPLDPLTVRGSWRRYEYEDERPELFFPGYAAFGESFFRAGIGQTVGGSPVLFNERKGYTRTAWSVGGSWRFGRPASLDVEYGSTEWEFDERQVEGTTEDIAQVRLRFEPLGWLSGRVAWLGSSRDFEGDYEVGFELSGVRDFSVWERDRTRWTAEVDFAPGDDWTVGVAYVRWEDEFPGVVTSPSFAPPYGTAFPYGLNRAESDSASVSASTATRRWTFAAAAGWDRSEWESLSVTKTDVAGADYNPANRWSRRQDDDLIWANVAIEGQVVPEKVRLDLGVGVSVHDGALETANLDAPNVNSAVAVPFPDLEARLYTARLGVRWTLAPGVDFEARYWHEPFRLDDFSWDALRPYMQGVVEEIRSAPSDVQPAAAQRYLFLDSRYSDYTANVLSALVRVRF